MRCAAVLRDAAAAARPLPTAATASAWQPLPLPPYYATACHLALRSRRYDHGHVLMVEASTSCADDVQIDLSDHLSIGATFGLELGRPLF